jgi:hypothetical protein
MAAAAQDKLLPQPPGGNGPARCWRCWRTAR